MKWLIRVLSKLSEAWKWLLRHSWDFSIKLTLGGLACNQDEMILAGLATIALTAAATIGGFVCWVYLMILTFITSSIHLVISLIISALKGEGFDTWVERQKERLANLP